MFASVLSAAIFGMEVREIQVEADVSDGLPSFTMVGFPSAQVREAQERVRTAFKNNRLSLPPKRVTVNFAPADMKKEGAGFDLPVAAAVLAAAGILKPELLSRVLVVGEISLNGEIHGVSGILPRVIRARELGLRFCIIPEENIREGKLVRDMQVFGVKTLGDMIRCLKEPEAYLYTEEKEMDIQDDPTENRIDFADVCGQEMAKRASEIAAAGFHNLLLVGPPGSGKSMIAERIPTIMPLMSREESIAVTKICSMAGKLQKGEGMVWQRPFLQPHHTITAQALVGGGNTPMPGIVTLAHRGVLFLDELPEFGREKLDLLRQPVEDKKVQIIRARYACTYPSDFLLAGAMNPCPCGYYPDLHKCNCTDQERERYQKRVSGALLNRLDICAEVGRIEWGQLQKQGNESSAVISKRVQKAINRQKIRYGMDNKFNADLSNEETILYCGMNAGAERILERTYTKYQLNPRSLFRIRRLARTIADLAESEEIREAHVSEAIALNKGLWHA